MSGVNGTPTDTTEDSSTESSTDTTTQGETDNPTTTDQQTHPAESSTDDSGSDDDGSHDDSGEDMFPRSYVERLRRESQGYRERANTATEYAERLHLELVRATGRLADPEDLPFDEAHLADSDAMTTAIDELLKRKPHLASRRPTGDIGQGASGNGAPVDLAAMLRARA